MKREPPDRTCRTPAYVLLLLMSGAVIPFRDSVPELVFQLALLPLSVLLVYLAATFFRGSLIPAAFHRACSRISTGNAAFAVISGFLVLDFAILLYEDRLFATFGYDLGFPTAAATLAVLLCVSSVLRFAFSGRFLAFSALLAILAVQFLSVISFPLHPGRSDMLPLVEIACRRFLSGESPYSNVVAWDGVMTYLPGLWLTYLPSFFLGLDVRYTNLACLTASFLLIHRTSRALGSGPAILPCLCAFFLNPWLVFRHEVYMPVVILQITLAGCLLLRRRLEASMAVFAWAVCSYPFNWVVFPLYLGLLYRISGRKSVVRALAWVAGAFLTLVLPFLLWAPGMMIHSVLGVWRGVCQIESYNVSFWVLRILPLDAMRPFQAAALLAFYAIAVGRIRNERLFFGYSVAAVLLFAMTSQLVWHYFFLLPPLFVLCHELAAEGGMTRAGSGA